MDFQQKPTIVVRKFFTKYQLRNGVTVGVDWIEYSPAHDPQNTVNRVRVKDLIPPDIGIRNDDEGHKITHMNYMWHQIEGAYKAWKEGREIPLDGTPLAAWAGLTPELAEVFVAHGFKTVESIAQGSETLLNKVHLPNVKQLRDLAKEYLESRDNVSKAAEMQDLRDELAVLREMLAEQQQAPKPAKGKPAKVTEAGAKAA